MTTRQTHYWDRFVDGARWRSDSRPPGEDLAALRKGLGREPGTVPAMWPFHHVAVPDDVVERGYFDRRYAGEHHALTLFAVHQQSQLPTAPPIHQEEATLGAALRKLHAANADSGSDKTNPIDRRFYAAVSATTIDEVGYHLRGLIRMLRGLTPSPALDYSRLARDLADWDDPQRRDRVRRRWGLQYHGAKPDPSEGSGESSTSNDQDQNEES